MTDEERLDAVGRALAAVERDPLQPACVARAFLDPSPPSVFGLSLPQVTMRAWLELELAKSPYVTGQWSDDVVEDVQALCIAVSTITGQLVSPESLIGTVPPEEVLAAKMVVAMRIGGSFETFLPLRRKPVAGQPTEAASDHGTGWWIKVMVRLVGDLNMSVDAAMSTPLPVAFALLAGYGMNDGMEPAGENWREREVLDRLERESELPPIDAEPNQERTKPDPRKRQGEQPDKNEENLSHT